VCQRLVDGVKWLVGRELGVKGRGGRGDLGVFIFVKEDLWLTKMNALARGGVDLHGLTRTYTDLHGLTRTYTDLHGLARTCTDLDGLGRTWTDPWARGLG
jgi:hypothetical protein